MPSKSSSTYFHQPSKNKHSFTAKKNKTYFSSQKITASSQQAVVGANYMETDKPPLRNSIWKLTSPDVAIGMVEHRWVPHSSDEAILDQMI